MDPRMLVDKWCSDKSQIMRLSLNLCLMSSRSSFTASRSTWPSYPSKSQPTLTSPLRAAPPWQIMFSIALSKPIKNLWLTMVALRYSSTTISSIQFLCLWLMLTDWLKMRFLNACTPCSTFLWFTPFMGTSIKKLLKNIYQKFVRLYRIL